MKFNEFLKTQRAKAGLSQEAVARHVGVTRGAVGQWEQGVARPSLSHLNRLCQLYELSFADFMGGDDGYRGEFVDDAEELWWLAIWRASEEPQRGMLRSMFQTFETRKKRSVQR